MANAQNTQSTANTQNVPNGTPATQHNQNTQNITINNNHGVAPDETGYTMPPDPGVPQWIYGDPNLTYNGSVPSNGVSLYTMQGTTPYSGQDNSPMPLQIAGMNSHAASQTAQAERMRNPLSMSDTHMPSNSEEAYQASLRSLLDRNIGYFVVASFLVGSQRTITWQGILHTVGSDYIVLYQPDYERYISCDIYSIKFVQFHNVKGIPYCAASQNWQGQISV
ncbi:MAG: hypothetical protein K2O18_12105 [Oscillospiraceae bacterium]|nr:hypothetical protein [Oscillospiraceae bacterium]